MAVNNTAKAYSNMEFPLSMKRQDALPFRISHLAATAP